MLTAGFGTDIIGLLISLKLNQAYWISKIERNIERDKENNAALEGLGYLVIRFWEHEIIKDLINCINLIMNNVNIRKISASKTVF